MKVLSAIASLCLLLPTGSALSECYAVVGDSNRVLYRAMVPPAKVDLSKDLSSEVGRAYPGGHLIISSIEDDGCYCEGAGCEQGGAIAASSDENATNPIVIGLMSSGRYASAVSLPGAQGARNNSR